MVFKRDFELSEEVSEGSHSDGGSSEGSLSKGSCQVEGGSFSHIEEGKGNFFSVSVIDFLVSCEVQSDQV